MAKAPVSLTSLSEEQRAEADERGGRNRTSESHHRAGLKRDILMSCLKIVRLL